MLSSTSSGEARVHGGERGFRKVWFWNVRAFRPGLKNQLEPAPRWPSDRHVPSPAILGLSPRLSPPSSGLARTRGHLQQGPFFLTFPGFHTELPRVLPPWTKPHLPLSPDTSHSISLTTCIQPLCLLVYDNTPITSHLVYCLETQPYFSPMHYISVSNK